MGDTSAHLLGSRMLNYCEMLSWNSPAILSPKYPKLESLLGSNQKRKKTTGKKKKKEMRFTGALVPFANNKFNNRILFCWLTN